MQKFGCIAGLLGVIGVIVLANIAVHGTGDVLRLHGELLFKHLKRCLAPLGGLLKQAELDILCQWSS